MAITPQQAAIKWRDRMGQSQQQITDGVNGVQTAPGIAAAAQKDLYLRQVTANADKWARRVASVDLPTWKRAMIDVGIPRVAQGAQAKVGKVEAFMNEFLPHVNNVAATVHGMPKGGLANGLARAAAQIQGNANFKRK